MTPFGVVAVMVPGLGWLLKRRFGLDEHGLVPGEVALAVTKTKGCCGPFN